MANEVERPELPEYLNREVRSAISGVIDNVVPLLPEQVVKAMFVCTKRRNPNDSRLEYPDVWLFLDDIIVQIYRPREERLQFEFSRFKNQIDWIRLTAAEYNPARPDVISEESVLELDFTTKDGVSNDLSANGEGCPELLRMYREQFIPNWVDGEGEAEQEE